MTSCLLAHFLERIKAEGAEERERIMMALVNVGAVLKYSPGRKATAWTDEY
jgi:hypothetical protein